MIITDDAAVVVGKLLDHYMEDIGWNFEQMTREERDIVQSPEMLKQIRSQLGLEKKPCSGR